jgi:hypothetical protein
MPLGRPHSPRRPRARRVASRRGASRRGATVVELLVTLTLVVLIGGTLVSLFVGQMRTYNRTREAAAIQNDLRTGLGFLPIDLRAASVALGDLVAMTDTALRMRATIGSSVVCERPNASTLVLPPLGLARNVLTSWYTEPAVGDWVAVYVSSDADPSRDSWRMLRVTAIGAAPAAECAGAPFTDPALDPPASKPRWRVTLSDTVSVTESGAGRPVRFLRLVKYALFRPNPAANRWYLGYADSVAAGWNPTEPVAGPFAPYSAAFAASAGIRFRYYDTLGVLVPAPTAASRIGRVDVALRGASRVRAGADSLVRDSLLLRIALRNRQVQ